VSKGDQRIPRLPTLALSPEQREFFKKFALTPEQRELFQRIGRQAAKGQLPSELNAILQRVSRSRSPEAQAVRAALAEAKRQAAEWGQTAGVYEAWLERECGLPPDPAPEQPAPALPPTAEKPPSETNKASPPVTLVDEARRGLIGRYPPNGRPPFDQKRETTLFEVNAWLKEDARRPGVPPPPKIKRDVLNRALGLRR
jgi:hypothetical protein